MALFHENGPFKIQEDLSLKKNKYSWSKSSNLVFVDQPIGTGFSKAKYQEYVKSEKEVI